MTHIVKKLYALAVHMRDLAADLDYYGGFDHIARLKARELLAASAMMDRWANDDSGHQEQYTNCPCCGKPLEIVR